MHPDARGAAADDGPHPPPPPHYLLQPAGGPRPRCTEVTTGWVGAAPDCALSRWEDEAGNDIVLETRRAVPGMTDEDVATVTLARSLAGRCVDTDEVDHAALRAIWVGAPHEVLLTPEALVVDGAPVEGVVARREDLVARVIHRGDHVITLVHPEAYAGIPGVAAGYPKVG